MAGETLKTVEKTFQVLRAFSRARPELSVAELVDEVDLPRAVVTRVVSTLERADFLERVPGTFKYRIGIAACELGAAYLVGNSLVDASRDILRDLAGQTGFTVYLGTRRGRDIVLLGSHEGRVQVRFTWAVGDSLPIATTALGKAILTKLSAREIDALLGRDALPALSTGSITTRAVLDAQLAEYAPKGWVPAFEESLPGIYAVGSALIDAEGRPVAGISVSFLRDNDDSGQVERMGAAVVAAARAINRRIAPHYAYNAERKVDSLSRSFVST